MPVIPTRLLLELAGVAALIVAFLFYRHSLIAEGEAQVKKADAALVAEQTAHNSAVHAQGVTTVFQEGATYHDAITAPVAHPVHARLCISPASGGRTVPGPARSGPDGHAAPALSGTGDGNPVPGPDIGPDLQAIAQRADAQVSELQHYILHVCAAR
jgi:hypothetical protein